MLFNSNHSKLMFYASYNKCHSLDVVVFLHGFLGTLEDFGSIFEKVSKSFHALAFDLPGHGLSKGYLPSKKRYFADLKNVILSSKCTSLTIVGYSMGGRIAMEFAQLNPSLVNNLIILSAQANIGSECHKNQILWEECTKKRLLNTPFPTFLDSWYSMPMFSSLKSKKNIYDAMIKRREKQSPQSLAAAFEIFRKSKQENLMKVLSSTMQQKLFLCGKNDKKYCSSYKKLNKLYPDCKLAVINSASHAVHLEAKECCSKYILEFLKEKHQ